ncbi:MAG: UDP-3-O-acyl-N-acetylglucosamine deacetylase [Kiritimatiellia bacterium]
MISPQLGRILSGNTDEVLRAHDAFIDQPVDFESTEGDLPGDPAAQTTLAREVSVTGPGTFFRRANRTLTFAPGPPGEGWWFDRTDLPDFLPIKVSIHSVWTTLRNIVLCSGSPRNYMRMVEHIVALKTGMGIDDLIIHLDSGDPPLFDRGSMDLVETLERGGLARQPLAPAYVTVTEPVTLAGPGGSFLTFRPCTGVRPSLKIDCAIDFPTAIGKQRIRLALNTGLFRHAARARTNCSQMQMVYTKTIGKLFADTRNIGYTKDNILIAGKKGYVNEPKMPHNGKSLEAVWHRMALDLLAAVALIDSGRFCGEIYSYKAGHTLDVQMIRKLYKQRLLKPIAF